MKWLYSHLKQLNQNYKGLKGVQLTAEAWSQFNCLLGMTKFFYNWQKIAESLVSW